MNFKKCKNKWTGKGIQSHSIYYNKLKCDSYNKKKIYRKNFGKI